MKLCSVDGCSNRSEKREMCGKHYYRWRMHGSPLAGRTPNGVAEKFLREFVDPQTDECVLWPFGEHGNGYGRRFKNLGYPHQFICEKFNGPPPSPDHETAHNCGNGLCINPRHVRWALHVDNEADKVRHGTMLDGERCGTAKLSDDEVRTIRLLFGSKSNADLGRQFSVSASTISMVGNRRTWRHI